MMAGEGDEPQARGEGSQRRGGAHGQGIVADVGAEDPEHPQGRRVGPIGHTRLQKLADACAANGIAQHFVAAASHADRARLEDLPRPGTNHRWMWTAGALGAWGRFDREEFTEAVRSRLGAGGPQEVARRKRRCGSARVGVQHRPGHRRPQPRQGGGPQVRPHRGPEDGARAGAPCPFPSS